MNRPADSLEAIVAEMQEHAKILAAHGVDPGAIDDWAERLTELSKSSELVAFFRGEGYQRFGWNGDVRDWSPERTAIEAMRELAALTPQPPASGGVVPDGWVLSRLANGDIKLTKNGLGDYSKIQVHAQHLLHGFFSDLLATPTPAAVPVEELASRFGSEYGTRNGAQPYWDFDRDGLLAFAAAITAAVPDAVRG